MEFTFRDNIKKYVDGCYTGKIPEYLVNGIKTYSKYTHRLRKQMPRLIYGRASRKGNNPVVPLKRCILHRNSTRKCWVTITSLQRPRLWMNKCIVNTCQVCGHCRLLLLKTLQSCWKEQFRSCKIKPVKISTTYSSIHDYGWRFLHSTCNIKEKKYLQRTICNIWNCNDALLASVEQIYFHYI